MYKMPKVVVTAHYVAGIRSFSGWGMHVVYVVSSVCLFISLFVCPSVWPFVNFYGKGLCYTFNCVCLCNCVIIFILGL